MVENLPSYYAIIPANVRYDSRLNASEKIFFSELSALCNVYGYCNASNSYFQKLYEISQPTLTAWLKKLQECGYIYIVISNGYKRKIYLHLEDVAKDTEVISSEKTKAINEFISKIKR